MKPTRSQPSSRKLINEGHTTGVFSHHIDATTALSDELTERGIDHEIIGLPECLSAALDAKPCS
jgi:ATP-dependent DNA helicase UvrD/PcrA